MSITIIADVSIRKFQSKSQSISIRQLTAAQPMLRVLSHQLDRDAKHTDTSIDIPGILIHRVSVSRGKIKTVNIGSTCVTCFYLDIVARSGGYRDLRRSNGFVFFFSVFLTDLSASGNDTVVWNIVEFQPVGKERLDDLSVMHCQDTDRNVQFLITLADGGGIVFTGFPQITST